MKGLIMRSTGSWYDVRNDVGTLIKCRLRGKFKLQIDEKKVTNPLAVGDNVVWEWEDKNENIGIITEIVPRQNYIIRKSVHKTSHSHILASNVDRVIIIATLSFPRTSLGFIDRLLLTAQSFEIPATIVFNKVDLFESEQGKETLDALREIYEPLGYGVLFTSNVTGEGIKAFEDLLKGNVSLLAGHSGVGKSTLVNSIAPQLTLRTKEVSSFANKGVHTTTFAEMFEISENTFIIDSPGIKELGLVEIAKEEVYHYFPEMTKRFGTCKFYNCLHLNEPNCAIITAVEQGEIAPSRYMSYISMVEDNDNRR